MFTTTIGHPVGSKGPGFDAGEFNPVIDYGVIPPAMAGMRITLERLGPPLGRLLHCGLLRFSRPPYGTIL